MQLEFYDIQITKDKFEYCSFNLVTKKWTTFIVTEEKNELLDLYTYLSTSDFVMVGFNNLHYHYPILHYILTTEYFYECRYREVLDTLSGLSDLILRNEYTLEDKPRLKQIDLCSIWHNRFSLNDVKFNFRFKTINDSLQNNISAICHLYKFTQGVKNEHIETSGDQFAYRQTLAKEFNFNCINWNSVKIGNELIKYLYCAKKNIAKSEIPECCEFESHVFGRDIILDDIKFRSKTLKNLRVTLHEKSLAISQDTINETIRLKDLVLNFKNGGLHSKDTPRKIDKPILEFDCVSMYASFLIHHHLYPAHLGKEWIEALKMIRDKRVECLDGDARLMHISKALKQALTAGGYGKLKEKGSWLYDPLLALKIILNNQLLMLMLIENFMANDIEVVSVNTDSIAIVEDDRAQAIINDWCKISGHTMKMTRHKFWIQTSVNDVLTDTVAKGIFSVKRDMTKDHSAIVVAQSLNNYFLKGIPPEDTVNQSNDSFDFCFKMKVKQKSSLEWHQINGVKTKNVHYLGRFARYVPVNNEGERSGLLLQRDNGNKTLKGSSLQVDILNEMHPCYLDKRYYIREIYKIINKIEVKQLTLF